MSLKPFLSYLSSLAWLNRIVVRNRNNCLARSGFLRLTYRASSLNAVNVTNCNSITRATSSAPAAPICQGTPPDFRPEPFRPELSLVSSTLWKRFRAGFTLNTFVDSYGRRVGGLVGDNGHLVEDICAYSHSA
ncbi:hypothetical protein M422DRAFT_252944 [Sphaerobolus stellatus SS14]|uniref:Uncharacterized protein n=1 Tax=Sphaerobolus stellatus (strain SS14) TaxID=990650 RepID=A0A0C9VXQ3_SPHS4|nr:hypothetical protein M422DRAFT_252944 [Sphaerobolus stellatus SS14]